jgi:hypothetical protein
MIAIMAFASLDLIAPEEDAGSSIRPGEVIG